MIRVRPLVVVPLVAALSMAGCSGDSDEGGGDAGVVETSAAESPDVPDAGQPEGADKRSRGCTASVVVSGGVEASWKAEAMVRRPQGEGRAVAAVYESSAEEGSLNAVSGAAGNPDVAVVSIDEQNYSTAGQEGTLDVLSSGRRADIDATAVSPSGDRVQLAATFTCNGKKAAPAKAGSGQS